MPETDWISDALQTSKKKCPGLTSAAAARLTEVLRGPLGRRVLPAGEITELARQLLADMEPSQGSTEAQ